MEVTDDQEDLLSEINFCPCVKFVKRGIAASKSIADVSWSFREFHNVSSIS
jgi:hypothetical protein